MSGIHPSAMQLASEIADSADVVNAFVGAGGRLGFSNGTNYARLFGISASCTVSEADAVKAWVRAVLRKAGSA